MIGRSGFSLRLRAHWVSVLLAVLSISTLSAQTFMKITNGNHQPIPGESKDGAHAGWIDVMRFSYDVSRPATGANPNPRPSSTPATVGPTNKVPTGPLASRSVVSPRDAATGSASGKRQYEPAEIPRQSGSRPAAMSPGTSSEGPGRLALTKITDKATPALMLACSAGHHFPEVVIEISRGGMVSERLILTDVLVSSIQRSPQHNQQPTENVTLNFAKITIERK